MKNFTNPIQSTIEAYDNIIEPEIEQKYELKLSPNEFTNKDDIIGFLQNEPDPFQFLSEDKFEKTYKTSTKPEYELLIMLSKRVNTLERQVYSFFTLIGDFGGFNGAIVIFPSLFLSFYSYRMFNASLLEDLPVRTGKKKNHQKLNMLKKKLFAGTPIENINEEDISDLHSEVNKVTKM